MDFTGQEARFPRFEETLRFSVGKCLEHGGYRINEPIVNNLFTLVNPCAVFSLRREVA
jgi:hypothetical protein